jgi:hypothetical protein
LQVGVSFDEKMTQTAYNPESCRTKNKMKNTVTGPCLVAYSKRTNSSSGDRAEAEYEVRKRSKSNEPRQEEARRQDPTDEAPDETLTLTELETILNDTTGFDTELESLLNDTICKLDFNQNKVQDNEASSLARDNTIRWYILTILTFYFPTQVLFQHRYNSYHLGR